MELSRNFFPLVLVGGILPLILGTLRIVVHCDVDLVFLSLSHHDASPWHVPKPRNFPNLGGKPPPFGGHRGRQGYAVHCL